MYQVEIKPSAKRELKKLPKKVIGEIVAKIESLADYPRPPGCKKLEGTRDTLWRVRTGDYRILYAIDDVIRIVDIHHIGHRIEVYKW